MHNAYTQKVLIFPIILGRIGSPAYNNLHNTVAYDRSPRKFFLDFQGKNVFEWSEQGSKTLYSIDLPLNAQLFQYYSIQHNHQAFPKHPKLVSSKTDQG